MSVSGEYGRWHYLAGASGTVQVPDGGRVVGIAAYSAAGGSLVIDGGNAIPIPAGAAYEIAPKANLVAAELIFTGTDSYFCEYVD